MRINFVILERDLDKVFKLHRLSDNISLKETELGFSRSITVEGSAKTVMTFIHRLGMYAINISSLSILNT